MEHQEEVVTKTQGASGKLRTEDFVSEAVGGVLFSLVNSSVLPWLQGQLCGRLGEGWCRVVR